MLEREYAGRAARARPWESFEKSSYDAVQLDCHSNEVLGLDGSSMPSICAHSIRSRLGELIFILLAFCTHHKPKYSSNGLYVNVLNVLHAKRMKVIVFIVS